MVMTALTIGLVRALLEVVDALLRGVSLLSNAVILLARTALRLESGPKPSVVIVGAADGAVAEPAMRMI